MFDSLLLIPLDIKDYNENTINGALCLKDEPAGKVRVFAMVDI
jgi:hypothetical protein